jgi:hypothetical protein
MDHRVFTLIALIIAFTGFGLAIKFAPFQDSYRAGAIAAHEGRMKCVKVPQFNKSAEWQCVEVVSE